MNAKEIQKQEEKEIDSTAGAVPESVLPGTSILIALCPALMVVRKYDESDC